MNFIDIFLSLRLKKSINVSTVIVKCNLSFDTNVSKWIEMYRNVSNVTLMSIIEYWNQFLCFIFKISTIRNGTVYVMCLQ